MKKIFTKKTIRLIVAIIILIIIGDIFSLFFDENTSKTIYWPIITGAIVLIIDRSDSQYMSDQFYKKIENKLDEINGIKKLNDNEKYDITNYIDLRLNDQINYYDDKSIHYNKYHENITIATIVLSACITLIPALNSFYPNHKEIFTLLSAIIGAIIVIIQSIDKLKKYEELFYQYRMTCEKLKQEKYLYLNNSGEYSNDPNTRSNPQLFVERCESIMATENGTWAQLNEKKKD